MPEFTIEGFAQACKAAMAASEDRLDAARACLQRTLEECDPDAIVAVLDAALPPGADIGEMVVHTSPELTLLYGRVPPRMQSGIHDHTVFACIGQLVGQERNVFFQRTADGRGLEPAGERTVCAGEVIHMPADAIHCIENPGDETSSALHVYGGDFRAVMGARRLWSSATHEEGPFTFEGLLRESAAAMRRDGNRVGLEALVQAIPKARAFVDPGSDRGA